MAHQRTKQLFLGHGSLTIKASLPFGVITGVEGQERACESYHEALLEATLAGFWSFAWGRFGTEADLSGVWDEDEAWTLYAVPGFPVSDNTRFFTTLTILGESHTVGAGTAYGGWFDEEEDDIWDEHLYGPANP